MRIAFWGEVHRCNTTTHMQAIADMLSVMCPNAQIVIGTMQEIVTGVLQEGVTGVLQKAEAEYCIFDCGTGLTVRKRHMLFGADLVVVNLRQEHGCIRRFFEENPYMARLCMARETLFILGGYECEAGIESAYLERVYRVESERICVIPYNNEYHLALAQGKNRAFIEREYREGTIRNEQFMNELQRIVTWMIRRK